jgi:hypothetical protein
MEANRSIMKRVVNRGLVKCHATPVWRKLSLTNIFICILSEFGHLDSYRRTFRRYIALVFIYCSGLVCEFLV